MRTGLKILSPLVVAALLGTGCSGINASQTVTPMMFLLPGLIKNCPQTPTTNEVAVVMGNGVTVASAR